MDNTTIQSGKVVLSAGATHKGTLSIWGGASVSANSGATIDFTISRKKAADTAYFINDLSRITGAPNYTVTVSDYQQVGVYELAKGAANFNGSVTITNGSKNFGKVNVSGSMTYGGKTYRLQKSNGNLTLAITQATNAAAPWDAVAGTSAEIAMPESASGCLFEESVSAPSPLDDTLFADSNTADLTIWQTLPESSIGVSTLTESTQNINTKFELLA